MPVLTKEPLQPTATSSFIGLQSYSEAQTDIFYGRDEEIDRLTNLVKANMLTIVFGKSGTGKTSLLNAGVFPRLRKDYCLPFRIRLDFQEESPDLVTQIKNTLTTEIDKYGFHVEAYPGAETLWEYFHREPLWKSVTPILIFDQFEEIFTLGRKGDALNRKNLPGFWEELADLIENSIPEKLKETLLNSKEDLGYSYKNQNIKTVFAFREEYLPEFESIREIIPSLQYSRFRLMPLNGHQAYQVITKTWKENIDAAQAHTIVGFFVNEADKDKLYEAMEIEPSLLSQVCAYIDKERLHNGKSKVTGEFLTRYPKEKILRAIYNEALQESNTEVSKANPGVVVVPMHEFVEDRLITDEGYRTRYTLTEYEESLVPGIELLKTKYFVREHGKSIELTHDVLTPLIKSDREERRKQLAFLLAKKKANRRALLIVAFSILAAIGIWYLVTDRAFKEKEQAENKAEKLKLQYMQDSVALANLQEDLSKAKSRLKDTIGNRAMVLGLTSDSVYSAAVYDSLLSKYREDSTNLARLQSQRSDWMDVKNKLEKNIAANDGRIEELQRDLNSNSRQSQATIRQLEYRISRDSMALALLRNNHNQLIKQYDNYIKQVSKEFMEEDTTASFEQGPNTLDLDLFYNASGKGNIRIPANMKIYLLPYNAANKKIIRRAKTYEINCDEAGLNAARGMMTARYVKGRYVFPDVPPGNYFVKICTYYGGYYSFTKKEGMGTVRWEISPPIR